MNRKEFAKRRKTLMRMVGEDGIAILPSAPVRTRSRDVEYRYRQDSDFYYLTGFAEPDSVDPRAGLQCQLRGGIRIVQHRRGR